MNTADRDGERIVYRCGKCGKPVRPGKGYVHVSRADAYESKRVWREFYAAQSAAQEGNRFIFTRVSDMPDVGPAHWQVQPSQLRSTA